MESAGAVILKLYLAGDSVRSQQAIAALDRLCDALPARPVVDVIDVTQEPARAAADRVLATPTLIRVAPAPVRRATGDLDDGAAVRRALAL